MKLVIVSKIKRYIKNTWFKLVKKPYLDFLEKRKKEKFHKSFVKNFNKIYGVHPDHINEIIKRVEKSNRGYIPNVVMTDGEYVEFLKRQLIESATLTHKSGKKPLFYDPEIINIHNEAIEERPELSIKEILNEERDNDRKLFKIQKLRTEKYK